MAKFILMTTCAICWGVAASHSETLELTFGPDQQRGYRPERFADQTPTLATPLANRSATEFSSQQRRQPGVWSRWYFQKLHNALPDE